MSVCIAVDAMGGDHGLSVTVPAVIRFLSRHDSARVLLVGQPEPLRAALEAAGVPAALRERLSTVDAAEVVAMDESPAFALRNRRQSSMRIAIEQVRDGHADACVSAGNTGALMAISRSALKMLDGIDRPAIAAQLPNGQGGMTTMLDLGANVDCSPEHLVQFAIMGSALVTVLDGKSHPLVGLLNIGEEAIKGNDVVKEAAELIRASGLNFHGNVEGNDVFRGGVDVVVCDGFVGNVALKTSEGVAQMIGTFLREEFSRTWWTRLCALVAMPVLQRLRQRVDHRAYNGASLIGLRGIVLKSHGSADVVAYEAALHRAHQAAANQLLDRIRTILQSRTPSEPAQERVVAAEAAGVPTAPAVR